jgi:hypothetical protein
VRAVLFAFFCIDRTIFLDLKLSGGAQFGLLMAATMVRNPHVAFLKEVSQNCFVFFLLSTWKMNDRGKPARIPYGWWFQPKFIVSIVHHGSPQNNSPPFAG